MRQGIWFGNVETHPSFALAIAIFSAGSDVNLSFDPNATWRREGMMRVRNDFRDFMELDSKEGRFEGGKEWLSSSMEEEGRIGGPNDGSQNQGDCDGMQMSMCTVC